MQFTENIGQDSDQIVEHENVRQIDVHDHGTSVQKVHECRIDVSDPVVCAHHVVEHQANGLDDVGVNWHLVTEDG